VVEVRQTERFAQWLEDLRDLRARARVQARIERLIGGNPCGDKSSQVIDIEEALMLARQIKENG
jgi:putative component of toxin-antitoxin plasmid stabilization module